MLDQSAQPAPDLIAQLAATLRAAGFAGEVETDTALRAAMSTDNSVYQIAPDVIVAPRSADDLVTLLKVMERAEFTGLALTGRGGGTGTNGQSLNRGVIVDMRRHMNELIELNAEVGWADVQPGMVLDDLNAQIRASGWFFAPETSTSTRCTMGGMVSTDASGKGSRVYGKTSDNILGLEIARPQGLLFSMDGTPDWARGMLSQAEAAARAGRQAFIDHTPRLNRRFTGYDLERACPETGGFEWWRLFPGSEGTLGLISRIRVRLRRIEAEKRLIVAGFDSFRNALAAATPLLAAEPTAIEVMDETVQAIAGQAGILNRLPVGLRAGKDQRVAYVFIEINGDDAALMDDRVRHCRQILTGLAGAGAVHVAADLAEIRELWAIRSAGVGLLGRVDGPARPVAFVEDTVVPPENLPAFIDDFLEVLSENGLGFGIYGHVDVGCLHIRPALNIDAEADRARLVAVSDAVYELTRKYGGIFWGEHGKGVRGAYLRDWIGAEAYSALQGVKAAFDPAGRYNPGKLVSNDAPIMGIATTPFRAFNVPDGDPLEKAFRCNGNAQCLSYAAATPMCPSFKASADLRHSPKGRADALRAWHRARAEDAPDLALREADLMGVMDSCLGCKACASNCPVQVDIPSMRSAFYANYFQRHARSLADRLVLAAERHSSLTHRLAPMLAPIWPLLSKLGEKLTGSVDMPARLATSLPEGNWLRAADLNSPLPERTVILVQDWFTALFDAEAQRDVIAGLKALGYHPHLLEMRPTGKAAYTAGDMEGFRRMAKSFADLLHRAAATGAPLVAFEPAFGMMLRQEYVRAGIALPQVLMVQEFLADEARTRGLPQAPASTSARLLSHCTEATAAPQSGRQWAEVFTALGLTIETPATGCCGMAGLFGHQRRHQPTSHKLFDLSWRGHVEADMPVLATGFSCRCQSARLTGRAPRHPLGLIADMLADGASAG
ncbi:FAD-binding oxidoreductase [Paracoccus sp. R12_1]|uniref:FAD-binding and (Fe-S)-binding domain-containing protein n=1 Tax=unclassified Paracoccus (in: a-proteobacteria) TaxID=2688777 RepID=UPI001ADBB539|nr:MULTISPECIES: FAD-binding and (Fe-S)-binding domain-containing protein [unclassified Paracoccus (in: a-proteobacteria)]MBO9457005.1 FAD-binding oxidoreductase [Paracoccus sp. R12_2]MBO9488110.1 FAD-binding oxidoreductase [Paracoccus sp. R12_1]